MTVQTSDRPGAPRNLAALLLGLAAAGIVALSIHVVMLTAGVPFPSAAAPAWARWLNTASSVVAVLALLKLARPRLDKWRFWSRLLVTFVVLVTIRETFRSAFMAGVVTSAWTFSLISTLPAALAGLFVLALLCTAVSGWARSIPTTIVAGLVVAGIYVLAPQAAPS